MKSKRKNSTLPFYLRKGEGHKICKKNTKDDFSLRLSYTQDIKNNY